MRRVNLYHAHGSPTGYLYKRRGCRCVVCRGQERAYVAAHRDKHPEETTARHAAWHAAHRDQIRARKAASYAAHPEEMAARSRDRKYGLLPGEWDAHFLSQGERCKCCGDDDPGHKHGWKTDHDHKTGTVRGILCHGCNTGIGNFHDDPERLMAAIEYLAAATL